MLFRNFIRQSSNHVNILHDDLNPRYYFITAYWSEEWKIIISHLEQPRITNENCIASTKLNAEKINQFTFGEI